MNTCKLLMMQQQNMSDAYFQAANGMGGNNMVYQEMMPWNLPHGFNNPVHFQPNPIRDHDPFILPPQPPSQYMGGMFNRRSSYGNYNDQCPSSSDHLRFISDTVLGHMGQPFGLQGELGKLTAQEIMDAKALAASKSHSEAERRRRERINNHLAKLRSLLPNTTKTDKASLLAEVIQHVKELKRQTSIIAESSPVPTETDELIVDNEADEDGRYIIKASLCCEDRTDLLPDLIKALKAMRLRTLKAEIATLGGRVKNVLFITSDDEESSDDEQHEYFISSIQEALKAVMEKSNGNESSPGNVKRQRTNII